MLDILFQWNRWGSAKLNSGYCRDITTTILPFVHTPEIVALTGMRRSGKTTVLYQLMDYLENQQIPKSAMLHMNFEEPGLGPLLGLDLLDTIYRTYREEIYPKGKAYLFFDEIQNIPDWERWARARNESEDIKIFLTGSSANLMSRELGTVLTGRHVNFHVSPLSFPEYLRFEGIPLPEKMLAIDPVPEIQNALNQYLQWGGLPEIVLSKNMTRRAMLLKQYFDDILFKDIAMRHQIRDISILRNVAVHLLTQTASLVSVSRIAKLFGISQEMATAYCSYIQESFLVDFVPFYSVKVAERNRNPQKVHAGDLGLRQVVSLAHSQDTGPLVESVVYQQLQRTFRGDIFYWKGKQEIDFVLRKGNSIYSLIQVAQDGLDDPEILAREMTALQEANAKFPQASPMLIAGRMPRQREALIVPLWNFLCGLYTHRTE